MNSLALKNLSKLRDHTKSYHIEIFFLLWEKLESVQAWSNITFCN